ncbi:hypothetical protein RD792_007746 [Penstemon davidsonii]|uniref:Uncharacterized protein n=1 Tax=Penstemon davidsonii TaxID=160366 RepID=A0ABR0D795_9LAMI|nr:hypothetical protein RD792_007746 [Penstemon davidsonii]
MASPPCDNAVSNWDFDCALLDDLPSMDNCFQWAQPQDVLPPPTSLSVEFEDSFFIPDCMKEGGSRKRLRSGACGASDSKAFKEKVRRDKLNDRQALFLFQELSCILEPGRPPKTDKAVILSDAIQMVIQLREEAQKLKESCNDLHGKITELKTEKNELRDEKLKLKVEKEKLEQQVKTLSTPPLGFLPHSTPMHAPFPAPTQTFGSKMMPFVGYPGIPMWQFMPPNSVDTSGDHNLRPPVA